MNIIISYSIIGLHYITCVKLLASTVIVNFNFSYIFYLSSLFSVIGDHRL